MINDLMLRLKQTALKNRVFLHRFMHLVKKVNQKSAQEDLMPGYVIAEIKDAKSIPSELYYMLKNTKYLINVVKGQVTEREFEHLQKMADQVETQYEEPSLDQIIEEIEKDEQLETELEDQCQRTRKDNNLKSSYIRLLEKVKTRLFYYRKYLKNKHWLEKYGAIKGKKNFFVLSEATCRKVKNSKPRTFFGIIKELLTIITCLFNFNKC